MCPHIPSKYSTWYILEHDLKIGEPWDDYQIKVWDVFISAVCKVILMQCVAADRETSCILINQAFTFKGFVNVFDKTAEP